LEYELSPVWQAFSPSPEQLCMGGSVGDPLRPVLSLRARIGGSGCIRFGGGYRSCEPKAPEASPHSGHVSPTHRQGACTLVASRLCGMVGVAEQDDTTAPAFTSEVNRTTKSASVSGLSRAIGSGGTSERLDAAAPGVGLAHRAARIGPVGLLIIVLLRLRGAPPWAASMPPGGCSVDITVSLLLSCCLAPTRAHSEAYSPPDTALHCPLPEPSQPETADSK
jgi:hypothetical protein